MDDQPISQPPSTRSKKTFAAIIILLLSVAGLAVALIWCIFIYRHDSATPTPGPVASTGSGPCYDGGDNLTPEGYTFYENTDLGYKFAYPTEWGDVNVTTTPIASETGLYVQGSFSAKEGVTFGGNAVDYVVGSRGGTYTDLPGYLQAAGEFYTVELWSHSDGGPAEVRHELHPIEPPYEQLEGCNVNVLVTHTEASELLGTPAADIYRINLQPENQYYGVNFVHNNPDAATTAQLETLVSTFQLIP